MSGRWTSRCRQESLVGAKSGEDKRTPEDRSWKGEIDMTSDSGSSLPPRSPGETTTLNDAAQGRSEEQQLVLQLQAREEAAVVGVVTRYQEMLIRLAMRHVANRATAEEVVQETWIAVLSGLDRFEGRSSLSGWICAILLHKAKDRGIREKRQTVFSAFDSETDTENGEGDPPRFRWQREETWPEAWSRQLWEDRTPEQLLASRQAMACLWRAIERLPTHQKDVLMLRDVQGIHTKEVCQQLKISETNFYVRLHRARERVKGAVMAEMGEG